MIFSLFAKSSARSNGILQGVSVSSVLFRQSHHLPNTLEVHRTNLDHMARLLTLQDTIATTTRHASNIEKLRAIDHVVILTSCYTNAICLNLEAQAALILPQRGCHPGLHPVRRNLSSRVVCLLKLLAATWRCLRV